MGDERRLPGRQTILETFNRHQVQYVLIGGAAARASDGGVCPTMSI